MHHPRGFTLVEMILTVSIFLILATGAVALVNDIVNFTALTTTAHELRQHTTTAQFKALSGLGDSNYGISIATSSYTLYSGTSYSTRNGFFEHTYEVPEGVTMSVLGDINFTRYTGRPLASSTIIITNTTNGTKQHITIHSSGLID